MILLSSLGVPFNALWEDKLQPANVLFSYYLIHWLTIYVIMPALFSFGMAGYSYNPNNAKIRSNVESSKSNNLLFSRGIECVHTGYNWQPSGGYH